MKSLFLRGCISRFKIFGTSPWLLISCTFLFTFVLPSAYAQQNLLEKRISISLNQVTLPDALSALADQAGCTFSYSSTSLPAGKRISIQRTDISLTGALKEILGNNLEKLQAQGNKVLIVLKKRSGSVKGTVKTSDGKAAEFVTISIKNIGGVTVDQNGNYLLKNIPEGSYIITASLVGLETQSKQVNIQANQTAVVDLMMNENSAQLNEVVVRGNKQNKFADKKSEYIARLPLENLENPQVYNVVTNAIIQERNITNYAEVFYNTPSVTPPSLSYSNGNEYFLRGFYSSTEFRDGLANYSGETEDPVNLERVEVLKGPSATLFGTSGGSFGGIINNVTKVPFDYTKGEVGYSGGSFGLSRLTLDYNTPLTKDNSVLFRVTAARHWENSFQDYGFKHTYSVNPTVVYKVNDRLTLRLSGEFYQQNSTMWQWFYFGPDVTVKNIKDLNVPYNRSSAGDQMTQSWSSSRVF
ncbi:MAG TPA: TonB-dependent receptor, partial [Pedobacter sp.]